MSDMKRLRKEYESSGVSEDDLSADPFLQFKNWFDDAVQQCSVEWFETNAMSLATADRSGRVTSRTVLLKFFDESGFMFFTNYDSEKGKQIEDNSRVSLLFHWPFQGRQIRIDGEATRTSREVSDRYFHSRPRGAQIGAFISRQSRVAPPRQELDRQYGEVDDQFRDQPIPLPETWGGYLVVPDRFEFWQGRVDRLHDRFRYLRRGSGQWQLDRLYP